MNDLQFQMNQAQQMHDEASRLHDEFVQRSIQQAMHQHQQLQLRTDAAEADNAEMIRLEQEFNEWMAYIRSIRKKF